MPLSPYIVTLIECEIKNHFEIVHGRIVGDSQVRLRNGNISVT